MLKVVVLCSDFDRGLKWWSCGGLNPSPKTKTSKDLYMLILGRNLSSSTSPLDAMRSL